MGKDNEQGRLHAILTYLRLRKIAHAHVKNVGRIIRRPNGQMVWGASPWRQPGVADIVACYKGKPLALEVKAEKGRVSPEQTEWLEGWEKSGGMAHIVRSVDDVEAILKYIDTAK